MDSFIEHFQQHEQKISILNNIAVGAFNDTFEIQWKQTSRPISPVSSRMQIYAEAKL